VRRGVPFAIESVLERANSSNREAGEAALELGAEECVPGGDGETATGP
jgi:ABC-type spermidine/putrescine transport system permease subunit II